MPYRRNRRYRRYRRARRPDTFPITGSGPQVLRWAARNSGKALSIATKVASMVNVEYKTIDTVGAQGISSLWSVIPVSLVGQGDDQTNRNGRSILAKAAVLHLGLNGNSTQTVGVRVRLVLVRDKEQEGLNPIGGQVFTSNSVDSLRVILDNHNRFRILYDKCYSLCPASTGGTSALTIQRFIPMSSHIKYINTSNATTAQGNNALFLFIICDNSDPGEQPTLNYQVRVRFIDN